MKETLVSMLSGMLLGVFISAIIFSVLRSNGIKETFIDGCKYGITYRGALDPLPPTNDQKFICEIAAERK